MKIRNSGNLLSIVLGLLLVMGIFSGMYLWLDENVSFSNQNIDDKYESIYQNLTVERTTLKTNIDNIRDSAANITESKSVYQTAINGFKGLGHILKLPLNFIDISINTFTTLINAIEIPIWVKVLVTIALLSTILFIVIGIIKGSDTL